MFLGGICINKIYLESIKVNNADIQIKLVKDNSIENYECFSIGIKKRESDEILIIKENITYDEGNIIHININNILNKFILNEEVRLDFYIVRDNNTNYRLRKTGVKLKQKSLRYFTPYNNYKNFYYITYLTVYNELAIFVTKNLLKLINESMKILEQTLVVEDYRCSNDELELKIKNLEFYKMNNIEFFLVDEKDNFNIKTTVEKEKIYVDFRNVYIPNKEFEVVLYNLEGKICQKLYLFLDNKFKDLDLNTRIINGKTNIVLSKNDFPKVKIIKYMEPLKSDTITKTDILVSEITVEKNSLKLVTNIQKNISNPFLIFGEKYKLKVDIISDEDKQIIYINKHKFESKLKSLGTAKEIFYIYSEDISEIMILRFDKNLLKSQISLGNGKIYLEFLDEYRVNIYTFKKFVASLVKKTEHIKNIQVKYIDVINEEITICFNDNNKDNKEVLYIFEKRNSDYIKIVESFIKNNKSVFNFNSIEADFNNKMYNIKIAYLDNGEIVIAKLVDTFKSNLDKYNRYLTPIKNEDEYATLYWNVKGELSLLTSNKDFYENEIYKRISDILEVKNLNILDDNRLVLEFEDYNILNKNDLKLELVERNSKRKLYIDVEYNNKLNQFIINLTEFLDEYKDLKARWDITLICTHERFKIEYKLTFGNGMLTDRFSRHILFKEFEKKNKHGIAFYLTVKNELSMFIDSKQKYYNEKFPHDMEIYNFNMNKGKIVFEVKLTSKEGIEFECKEGILLWRSLINEEKFYYFEVIELEREKNSKTLRCSIDIEKQEYELFYWDFYFIIKKGNEEIRIRIKKPNKKVKKLINNEVIKFTYRYPNGYAVYPYITGNNCLSIAYRSTGKFESIKYKKRERLAYNIYRVFEEYLDKKNIWLIYEKFSETAQDNSYFFYKYCHDNHPEKNIYYVMNKKSPDYKKLEGYTDKVVDFMSVKHLVYLCAAQILISSESKGHCYAWRVQRGKIKEKLLSKKMVFLQHGVTAMKRVDYVFKKTAANKVDLFVATSEYEKSIINKYFNYDDSEIIITGFTRWDVLKDTSKENKRKEIFLMPTWRNWLDDVEPHVFEQSNYFKNYIELLNSKRLAEVLEKNDLYINYFVHPKFKAYLDKFTSQSDRINVIQPGEAPVNELMMRSSLLITDYSSVAFDMYYQKKPVLFYHFDIDDYNKYQGSYIDLENELFGDRAMTANELISLIDDYASNGFKEKKEYMDMRSKFFKYVDNNNCERVYQAINDKLPMLMKKKKKVVPFKEKLKRKIKRTLNL